MLGIVAVVIAYLLGGIPFGFLLVKLTKGADVRESGSGNIGATNVLRTTGRAAGVATLVLDIAKGYIAVWIAAELTGDADDDLIALGKEVGNRCIHGAGAGTGEHQDVAGGAHDFLEVGQTGSVGFPEVFGSVMNVRRHHRVQRGRIKGSRTGS